ncbi:flagellar basal body P-ring biosynthesis protein FlgA [compost metagenome]
MIKTFLGFAIISLLGFAAFARPELVIPNEVEISQREMLRLGDIALVSDAAPELLAILDHIVIRKDARELLLSQHLKSSEVLAIVREQLKENSAFRKFNPALKIPSQVKVSFSSAPISKQEVERKVMNHLKARCQECEFKVNIQSTPFPSGKQWSVDYSQLAAKGGFLLPIQDGDARSIKWVSGNIRMSKLTPTATRMISQGERVQSTDMQLSLVDVTFAKDSSVEMKSLEGQLAARSIPVGSPIWISDLKREPAAARGQIVKALMGDESFEISLSMQAEENGFIGDTIKVKNTETKKLLSGVIVEKGVVKLQ